MRWSDYPKWGKWAADWAARYHAGLRDQPVRAQVKPGETLAALPLAAPDIAEPMEVILARSEELV